MQLRDVQRKVEALAGAGKAAQLKAIVEKEGAAAAASNRVFAARLQLLKSNLPPSVRITSTCICASWLGLSAKQSEGPLGRG